MGNLEKHNHITDRYMYILKERCATANGYSRNEIKQLSMLNI